MPGDFPLRPALGSSGRRQATDTNQTEDYSLPSGESPDVLRGSQQWMGREEEGKSPGPHPAGKVAGEEEEGESGELLSGARAADLLCPPR